jgi:hypothetical protein
MVSSALSDEKPVNAADPPCVVGEPFAFPDPEIEFNSQVAIVTDPETIKGYLLAELLPDAVLLPLDQAPIANKFKMIIFHTDLTVSSNHPTWRSSFSWKSASTGAVVWNACATNISKRRIHRAVSALGMPSLQVSGELVLDTHVIVKSNQNCGGIAESRLAGTVSKPTRVHQVAGTKNYIVCELREVDRDLKQHVQVVIERYVENAQGIFFRVYRAGVRFVVCQAESKNQIKQMGFGNPRISAFFPTLDYKPDCEIEFLEAARQASLISSELGLQFGTVDLVMDDTNVLYVCDVNSTPFWEESEKDIELFLRDGIRAELV